MEWFNYLKEEGYFEPSRNPDPVAMEEGYSVPYWESLDFLEKLASNFKNGERLELVEGVLNIIKSVSDHPKDNYHTWYAFLKIINSIPNELIPIDIFQYMPIWLQSRFRVSLQTVELCDKLLPKFLKETPTEQDVLKAEEILKYLFAVRRKVVDNSEFQAGGQYVSDAYLYFLKQAIISPDLKEKIIRHCRDHVLLYILDQINLVLRNNPVMCGWTSGDVTYKIEYLPNGVGKILNIRKITLNEDLIIFNTVIQDVLNTTVTDIIIDLSKTLQSLNISMPNDEPVRQLTFGLSNDLFSCFGYNSFPDLGNEIVHGDEIIPVFALCLRELFKEKAIKQPGKAKGIFKQILNSTPYNLPFFRRLILYSISSNWQPLKEIFWQMISPDDPDRYFSHYVYHPELYYLLQSIQSELTEPEVAIIKDILTLGPKASNESEKNPDLWRHRWLTALRDNPSFKSEYENLTDTYQLTERDYEKENKIQILRGSLSPYNEEEILALSAEELLDKILSFKGTEISARRPSIDGLAEALGKSVENSPDHFDSLLNSLLQVPYIYIYYIINGYFSAWKAGKSFDWKQVLEFCLAYITQDSFIGNKLILDGDPLLAKRDWVVGSIGRLISQGVQNDENAYSPELLPITKNILIHLAHTLTPHKRSENDPITHYPMHFANSTEGEVLRAVLDYSLREARLASNDNQNPSVRRWDSDMQDALAIAFDKGLIEGYTLVGMYLEQFYYLDAVWTREKIVSWYELPDELWIPFISGLVYGRAAVNRDRYTLAYPHYKRAISQIENQNDTFQKAIVRHLIVFYLWNYEDISNSTSLNFLSIERDPVFILQEYVQSLWEQTRFLNDYSPDELDGLRTKVLTIWKLTIDKFQQPNTKEERILMASLVHLVEYLQLLNEETVSLINKSTPFVDEAHNMHNLLEELLRFSNMPGDNNQSVYVAEVLKSLSFKYIYQLDQEILLKLVTFLYDNRQKDVANLICNKVQMLGTDFLKDLYFRNNN